MLHHQAQQASMLECTVYWSHFPQHSQRYISGSHVAAITSSICICSGLRLCCAPTSYLDAPLFAVFISRIFCANFGLSLSLGYKITMFEFSWLSPGAWTKIRKIAGKDMDGFNTLIIILILILAWYGVGMFVSMTRLESCKALTDKSYKIMTSHSDKLTKLEQCPPTELIERRNI